MAGTEGSPEYDVGFGKPVPRQKSIRAENDAMLGLPWREEPVLDPDLLSRATLLWDGNVRARIAYM
jgi:hypothetical protein